MNSKTPGVGGAIVTLHKDTPEVFGMYNHLTGNAIKVSWPKNQKITLVYDYWKNAENPKPDVAEFDVTII